MSQPTAYHVRINNMQGGWDVITDDPEQSDTHFDTQEAAVNFAKKSSVLDEANLYVHDQQGNVVWQAERSRSGDSSTQRVFSEAGSPPVRVRVGVDANTELPLPDNQVGIPQGQTQPKGKNEPPRK